MPLKIACQMDPIDRIDIRGDSTFALLLEAQSRGHEIFYYTPPNLSLQKGRLIDAVKHIREASGLGLKESKERVDAWLERNPQALARFKAEASAEMKRFIRKVSVFLMVALLALLAYLSLRAGF